MAGDVDIDWRNGFNLQGKINGKNLNPARFDPDWKGVANFRATVKMSQTGSLPLKGSISASLLESRLHGQPLTGELQAQIADNNLNISRLLLHGKGFDLQASGELNRRLVLAAQVTDVSGLVPGSAGALQADGWLRWHDRHLSGAAAATGSNLAYDGTKIAAATLTARRDNGTGSPLHIAASLRDVAHNGYTLNNINAEVNGTPPDHTVNVTLNSDRAKAEMAISAGYTAGLWKGKITRLTGSDGNGLWNLAAPALFAASARHFNLSPLTVATAGNERLEIVADLAFKPLGGEVRVQWSGLDLARANPYLADSRITGSSHGKARIGILSEEQLTISGSASGSGTFTKQGQKITLEPSSATFKGNQQGMQIGIELVESTGGRLKGTFSSSLRFDRLCLKKERLVRN
jgi:translocation and assembly module TamB